MPTRSLQEGVCAVCGNDLLVNENEEGIIENTYKLTCEHVYAIDTTAIFLYCINFCLILVFMNFA